MSVVDQVAVAEALSIHASDHRAHLIDGVQRSVVVAARELGHVAVQVLWGHLVDGVRRFLAFGNSSTF